MEAAQAAQKMIKPEEMNMLLCLMISENMNWTDYVDDTLRNCRYQLRSRRSKGFRRREQREKLAERGDTQQTQETRIWR